MRTDKEFEIYNVSMTQSAEDDLNEIIIYIAQNSPQTALKIMEKIQKKIKTLERFPNRGGYVTELLAKNIKEYRQITESPWKIIYKVENNNVNILTIIDSRRNLQDILIRKLIQ